MYIERQAEVFCSQGNYSYFGYLVNTDTLTLYIDAMNVYSFAELLGS